MGTNTPHTCIPGLVWQKQARRFSQFELKVGELGFPIHFVCVSAALYHRGVRGRHFPLRWIWPIHEEWAECRKPRPQAEAFKPSELWAIIPRAQKYCAYTKLEAEKIEEPGGLQECPSYHMHLTLHLWVGAKRFSDVSTHACLHLILKLHAKNVLQTFLGTLLYAIHVCYNIPPVCKVHAPAAGPPLHSGGPQKLRQFLAVSGLPLTAVIVSFLKGLIIIDNS